LNQERRKIQTIYAAIKDANKSISDDQALAKLTDEQRSVLRQYAELKGRKEIPETEKTSDDEEGPRSGKKARFADQVKAIASMSEDMLKLMKQPTAFELQLLDTMRQRQQSTNATSVDTIQARLHRLKQLLDSEDISDKEYSQQRQRILNEV
jgi:hypothetical protein